MGDVVYRSEVKVERIQGPLRRAFLPGQKEPILFGVHGIFADNCPLYRTLKSAIAITTELAFERA